MKRSFIMVFLMAGALGSMADTVIAAPVQVSAGQKCFRADVMATSDDRAKGLMFRDGLADDEGMLFVFDEPGEYPFWMKNMKFPIDMVWLDEDRNVTHIEAIVPPCKKDPCPVYSPHARSLYVLELAAGQADAAGIKEGSSLLWK